MLLFVVVVVFSFTLLAGLYHRTKIIFEKLTHWFIRINSLLLLKSEQNKIKFMYLLLLTVFYFINPYLSMFYYSMFYHFMLY